MKLTPLRVGVQIDGLSLDQELAAEEVQQLRKVWAERQLVLFRGQKISPDRQIQVMKLFGNVLDEKQDGLNYQYVSGEETAIKPSRLLFHSDTHYTQVPLEL